MTTTFTIIDLGTNKSAGALTPGCTLYQSELPKQAAVIAIAPPGTSKMFFWLDGGQEIQQWSQPFSVAGKPPVKAVDFSKVGSHVLFYGVDDPTQRQSLSFWVAAKPAGTVAQPTVPTLPTSPSPATLKTVSTEMSFDPNATGVTVENVLMTSADGNGFAGNVRGTNVSIVNANFENLSDGFHYVGCKNLVVTGGGQLGKVSGRCHFFLDVQGLTWTGDAAKVFGPASTQSPIRFSSPGVRGGLVTGVRVTQAGSSFPIACWAIHAADSVHFLNCSATDGEFSFNSAGVGENDKVSNCIVENLTVTNSKLSIDQIAFGNLIKGGKFTNPTGEAISVSCLPGSKNVIDGAEIHSDSLHAIHFYTTCDLVFKNCTFYRTNPKAVFADGCFTPANDGGGNKIVDVSEVVK